MTTNRDRAHTLLESGTGSADTRALTYAVLALVDAVEAKTFPALEVKKCLGGLGFSVRPKR